jgi:cell division protein FtsX
MKYLTIPKIIHFTATTLAVFFIGFFANLFYQSRTYHDLLASKVQIAVFINDMTKSQIDSLKEKLSNLDTTADITYLPREKVLEKALAESPEIKNILIDKNNPFSAYFLVEPKNITQQYIENFKTIVSSEGVKDICYDANLVKVIENLNHFTTIYIIAAKIIFFLSLAIIAWRLLWRIKIHDINWNEYLVFICFGALTGALGFGFYYLFSNFIFCFSFLQIPVKYLLYFIPCGVFFSLLWEK